MGFEFTSHLLSEFAKGLLMGIFVSALNHFLTVRALGKWEGSIPSPAKGKVLGVYILRYALNFLTLFLFYKNVPALIGAALGLTTVKNILFIKHLIKRKG